MGAHARSAGTDSRTSDDGPRLRAAPVARRAAADLGIELASLAPGSGPNGRITLDDVRRASASNGAPAEPVPDQPAPSQPAADQPAGDLEPLTPLKRAVARRMAASQREIPQFQLVREVDATHLLAQKDAAAAAAAAGPRPGVNDLLVQAIGEMVARHPDLGATFVAGGDGRAARAAARAVHRRRPRRRDRPRPARAGHPPRERAHACASIAAERVRLVEATRAGRLDARRS